MQTPDAYEYTMRHGAAPTPGVHGDIARDRWRLPVELADPERESLNLRPSCAEACGTGVCARWHKPVCCLYM